jgi:hypothetical protein
MSDEEATRGFSDKAHWFIPDDDDTFLTMLNVSRYLKLLDEKINKILEVGSEERTKLIGCLHLQAWLKSISEDIRLERSCLGEEEYRDWAREQLNRAWAPWIISDSLLVEKPIEEAVCETVSEVKGEIEMLKRCINTREVRMAEKRLLDALEILEKNVGKLGMSDREVLDAVGEAYSEANHMVVISKRIREDHRRSLWGLARALHGL